MTDRRYEHGAVAVEFALVLPLLVLLLVGILDYGVWYADSLTVKHGAYEAARWGTTAAGEPAPADCGLPDQDLVHKTVCVARDRSTTAGGPVLVAVAVQGDRWVEGNELLVCTMTKTSLTGLAPLPDDSIVRSLVVTRIEESAADPEMGRHRDGEDGDVAVDWSWCRF